MWSWERFIVAGTKWDKAKQAFDEAMAVSPDNTRQHSWYAAYLITIGREQEALAIARERVEERPEDLGGLIALGLFLYINRHFAEARTFLEEVADAFPQSWPIRFIQALVEAAIDKKEGMFGFFFRKAKEILHPKERYGYNWTVPVAFPGLFSRLAYCTEHHRSSEKELITQRCRRYFLQNNRGVEWSRAGRGGLYFGWPISEDLLNELRDIEQYWTPLQLALAYMGLGDVDSAVSLLRESVENRGDPWTLWLHIMALIFDSLRERSDFQDLIDRLKLPEA